VTESAGRDPARPAVGGVAAESPSLGKVVLAAGILIFILAKAFFILSQTSAMGMPRLGDDSFAHLWHAALTDRIGALKALEGDLGNAPRAVKDIQGYCLGETQGQDTLEQHLCDRLAFETAVPDPRLGGTYLLTASLNLGLPLKWTYALFEVSIAVVIGLCVGYFLLRLVGPVPAGVAMAWLAFMTLFPPQGLHQFIPSTLTIGLSLGAWGIVIRRRAPQRYILAALAFVVLSRFHPISLVYAGGFVVIAVYAFREHFADKRVVIGAAVTAVVLALIVAFSEALREVVVDALSSNLIGNFADNVAALPSRLADFAGVNWGIVAAFLAGLLFIRRIWDGWVAAVVVALALLMLASLFYKTEFFLFDIPLDLFARIWVGFTAVGCGLTAVLLVRWTARGEPTWRRVAAAAAIVLLPVPSIFPWIDSLYGNMNGRAEVIDDRAVAKTVASFDRSATLAYGEMELAPQAVFLSGGEDLGLIPMRGLGQFKLKETLDERKPAAVVLPNFPLLDSLSMVQARTFQRRRYGFDGEIIDSVGVTAPQAGFYALHFRIENDGSLPVTLAPVVAISQNRQGRRLRDITVAPGSQWVTVEVGLDNPAKALIVTLPEGPVWITGISTDVPPRPGVNWPWDGRALVQWHVRGAPRDALVGLPFIVPELFRFWKAPGYDMIPFDGGGKVISDESGLVFIQTDYSATP
jgi:hypothetical protein